MNQRDRHLHRLSISRTFRLVRELLSPPDITRLQAPRRCGPTLIAGVAFCAASLILFCNAPSASAATVSQQPNPQSQAALNPPPDTIAWWRYQPAQQAESTRQTAITTTLAMAGRAAIASGLLAEQRDAASMLEALVAALAVTDRPHTLAILDVSTDPVTGELATLSAVLVIAGNEGHQALLRTVRTVLIDAPRAKPNQDSNNTTGFGKQRRFTIPPGPISTAELEAIAYTEPGWPAWRQISWCSTPDAFIVALGHDALQRWFNTTRDANPPWQPHLQTASATRKSSTTTNQQPPKPSATLHAWFNIDTLRQATPDWFNQAARPSRFLAALNLANARSFMLHAALIPPTEQPSPNLSLIALTATWSARSEPPSVIRAAAVAPPQLPPAALELIPPNTRVAMAVQTDAEQWLRQSLDAYAATMRTERAARYSTARNAWLNKNRQPLARVLTGIGDWLIISDGGSIAGPATNALPLPTVILADLKPGTSTRAFISDMRTLMNDFNDHVSPTSPQSPPSSRPTPTTRPNTPLAQWTVHADTNRRFAIASWGIAARRTASSNTTRAVLVGGLDISIALNPQNPNTNNTHNPSGLVARLADWLAKTPQPE